MTQAVDLKNLLNLKKLSPDAMEEISQVATSKEDLEENALSISEEEKEEESEEAPALESITYTGPAYRGIFLHQVIRKNGTRLKPDIHGVFLPTTEEEIAALEYFTTVGRAEKLN